MSGDDDAGRVGNFLFPPILRMLFPGIPTFGGHHDDAPPAPEDPEPPVPAITDPGTGVPGNPLVKAGPNGVPKALLPDGKGGVPGLLAPAGPADDPAAPPKQVDNDGKTGFPTQEQQSGRAADAIRKLHAHQSSEYDKLGSAEQQLSEILLNAHAANADGQQKLDTVQHDLDTAITNNDLSTPAGEKTYLRFLRGESQKIRDVLTNGTLSDDDHAKATQALADMLGTDDTTPPGQQPDQPPSDPGTPAPTPTPAPAPSPAPAPVPDPGMPDPSMIDPGIDPGMEDPGLVGYDPGMGMGQDPLSELAQLLPMMAAGAGTPFSSGGMGPLDSLSQLPGMLSGAADHRRDDPDDADDDTDRHHHHHGGDEKDGDGVDHSGKGDQGGQQNGQQQQPGQQQPGQQPPGQQPPGQQQPQPVGNPGDGAAPAGTPPVPATAVQLPDGSTANAHTPALANAVKAHIGGSGTTPLSIEDSYRQNGMELPPPGTPITNPVDNSQLSCGMLGMFKDHYEMVLSSAKALQNGQVVPLSAVQSSPDFIAWFDPSTMAPATPQTGVPAPPAVPAPALAAAPAPAAPALPTPTG